RVSLNAQATRQAGLDRDRSRSKKGAVGERVAGGARRERSGGRDRAQSVSEENRIAPHSYFHSPQTSRRIRQRGGVCAIVRERSCATRAEDRDSREDDCEAKEHAGLRRLDAERAWEEFGGSVHCKGEAEGDSLDAVDGAAGREGREDRRLH